MAIKHSSRKAKGRALQKWVCERISSMLSIPWGKDCLIESREMGQSGVDVKLIGRARERFPFSIECKFQQNWAVPSWVKQARDNQAEGTDWLLVMKKNHRAPVVVMDATRFFDLMERIYADQD